MSRIEKIPASAALDSTVTAEQPDGKAPTKSAAVLTLLQRETGATLAELIEATNWQPHTTRAMLTGLRKKGHVIERGKREDVTCYYLPATDA
jgi:DNA-binding MarR family transcriptional regulator